MGRPSKYTLQHAELICKLTAEGWSLVDILKEHDIADYSTVKRWEKAHDEFRDMYARAHEDQADYYAAEMLAIARKTLENPDNAAVQAARLVVDTLKFHAMKLKPKRYGDRIAHETDGLPINITIDPSLL